MQIRIEATPTATGWEVRACLPATGAWLPDAAGQPLVRKLTRCGADATAFPQPPAEDIPLIPRPPAAGAGLTAFDMCVTEDWDALNRCYSDIIGRAPGDDGVARFGSYLFLTLIGEALWAQLQALVAAEAIELALAWRPDTPALNRLPWEMMRSKAGFLAQAPGLVLTRRVAGPGAALAPLPAPPRVLFAVGSNLNDPEIRPGAEYLGLLRTLRKDNLGIKPLLLLDASPDRLKKALAAFKPDVVHFICHGALDIDGSVPYLELRPDDPNSAPAGQAARPPLHVRAEALAEILQEAPPQVVVLNACYTATPGDSNLEAVGQIGAPLAVDLVRLGTPVVLGMAGQVADRACRLFTARFYASLLGDGDLGRAAAAARRAGITHLEARPESSVDWALPTLFLDAGLTQPKLTIERQAYETDWQAAASQYATEDYPPFCGRFDILEWYTVLMADGDVQAVTSPQRKEVRVLAVAGSPATDGAQYGKSRLLRELAAQALRDGHVPVLIDKTRADDPNEYIKTPAALLAALHTATLLTARSLDLAGWSDAALDALRELAPNNPAPPNLPAACRGLYKRSDPQNRDVVACALQTDLLSLLDAARQQRPPAERDRTRLLLLVDDVHLLGSTTAQYLLWGLLGGFGLASAAARKAIRTVFTYRPLSSAGVIDPSDTIRSWITGNSAWVQPLSLEAFRSPAEDRVAYTTFLLNWRDPGGAAPDRERRLALIDDTPEQGKRVNKFLDRLRMYVKGAPGLLRIEGSRIIRYYMESQESNEIMPILRDATDEDQLAAGQGGTGGRP